MPLYMDVHNIEGGVDADAVAKAHEADLAAQGDHGVGVQELLGRRRKRHPLLRRGPQR